MLAERLAEPESETFILPPALEAQIEAELNRVAYELSEQELRDIFADNNLLALYWHDIQSCRRLTQDEELEYARAIKTNNCPEAITALAFHNIPLVIHLAKKYASHDCPMAELIQEGSIGLMKAVHKFDPDKLKDDGTPHRFGTYAYYWIWYYTWAYAKSVYAYTADIELDAPAFHDSEESLASLLPDFTAQAPEQALLEEAERTEFKEIVEAAIAQLGPTQPSRVIKKRYGIGGEPPRSIAQTALELKIGEGTVRSYRETAIRTLRQDPSLRSLAGK